jgi:HEAT repeat protein
VRLSAIGGLEQLDGPGNSRYLEVAAHLLTDPEIDVRLRVLPALLAADDPVRRAAGRAELLALLHAPDPHTRARALGVVGRAPPGLASAGQAGASAYLPEVVRLLADGADEVRLAAALVLEQQIDDRQPGAQTPLGAANREALRTSIPALLRDPLERARVAGVTVLGRLSMEGGPDVANLQERLVEALVDPSPEVRERAVEVLVRAGPRVVPEVREKLEAADPEMRKMAAVVVARIEPRRYASLIRGPILEEHLFAIYRNLECVAALAGCPGPAAPVLRRALGERNAALLDEVFYLLAAIQDPAAITTIAQSLRSPQPEVRANATEALESLTSPRAAALVGPLFEPELPCGPLLSPARQTWEILIPTPVAALRALLSPAEGSRSDAGDAWQRTMAAAVLAELSVSVDLGSDGEIAELLTTAQADADPGVRAEVRTAAARSARENGQRLQPDVPLSAVEKVIYLAQAPFFRGMTVEQLRVLAGVCEEEFTAAGAHLFSGGDPGGALYVVISGLVGIEQEKRSGSSAQLATVEAGSYLGESDFFDDNPRSHSAVAIRTTRTLRLRRAPLIALARQHPELSLELISVLGTRLREANDRIADLTRTHPRELHKLFDQFT